MIQKYIVSLCFFLMAIGVNVFAVDTQVSLGIVHSFSGEINFDTGEIIFYNGNYYTSNTGLDIIVSADTGSVYDLSGDIQTSVSGVGTGMYTTIESIELDTTVPSNTIFATFTKGFEVLNTDPLEIIFDNLAPTVPVLITPNDAVQIEGNTLFDWEASVDTGIGIKEYEFFVATDILFTDIVFASTGTDTQYTLDASVLTGENYYRVVKAQDFLGHTSRSEIRSVVLNRDESNNDGNNTSSSSHSRSSTTLYEKDDCPDGDFSDSLYDETCAAEAIDVGDRIGEDDVVVQYIDGNRYNLELANAYQYAYKLGITTQPDMMQAQMFGYVIRKHLAKMITEYSINVLDREPDTSRVCVFGDIAQESEEMKYYMQTACQLGLMGLEYDGRPAKLFAPNEYVSRAQFGTVFSRLLFGTRYNGNSENWYIDHLKALNNHEVMKVISSPYMWELRGYVMLMMQRADMNGTIAYTKSLREDYHAITTEHEKQQEDFESIPTLYEEYQEQEEEDREIDQKSETVTLYQEEVPLTEQKQVVTFYEQQQEDSKQYIKSLKPGFTFYRPYEKGEQSSEVKILQEILAYEGLYDQDIHGVYSNATVDAVFLFQLKYNLLSDNSPLEIRGYLGPQTRDVLNSKYLQ